MSTIPDIHESIQSDSSQLKAGIQPDSSFDKLEQILLNPSLEPDFPAHPEGKMDPEKKDAGGFASVAARLDFSSIAGIIEQRTEGDVERALDQATASLKV